MDDDKITLSLLRELGACCEARRAFAETFGEDAQPTCREVFTVAAHVGRADWIHWLYESVTGFGLMVGNAEENGIRNAVSGQAAVEIGILYADGSATVDAYGSSTVRAYGSATVRAHDSSTVDALGSATVRAHDSSTVDAYGSSTVRANHSATVRAYGSSTVDAYGSSTVRANHSATVRAHDSSTVDAYDSSTVLISRYSSAGVQVTLDSALACAVDRRLGPPQLLRQGQPAADALAEALREMYRVVADPAPEDDIATALEAARAALAAYDAARKGEGSTTVVSDALAAFVRAHDDYHAKAAASKRRWYDADARAKCHLALSTLQRAEAALIAAFKAKEAG